jgi:hypothetical integral membrane protein (TIGR02206 family)
MIANFINKFFGFFDYGGGSLEQFSDHLGHGTSDIRHFIWIGLTILLIIAIFIIKKKKTNDKIFKVLKVLLAIMFLTRLARQVQAAMLGVESPYWRAIFPIHLCSIMIYLLPIVVLFDLDKIKKPVYFLCILGGTITILDGDYFDSLFMTFGTIEGMYAHTLILLASIFLLKYENKRFSLKDYIKSLIGITMIALWATVFNIILGVYYTGSNYLYLVHNMLPIGGNYFVYLYFLIYIILLSIFYFCLNIKHKQEMIKELKSGWKNVALTLLIMLVLGYVVITLTRLFAVYG